MSFWQASQSMYKWHFNWRDFPKFDSFCGGVVWCEEFKENIYGHLMVVSVAISSNNVAMAQQSVGTSVVNFVLAPDNHSE